MNKTTQRIAAGLRSIHPLVPLFFLTTENNPKEEILGFKVYQISSTYMRDFPCKNGQSFNYLPVFNNDYWESIQRFLIGAIEDVSDDPTIQARRDARRFESETESYASFNPCNV